MIRLGWRLTAAGGRSSAIAVGLTALAVAIGTAILLYALSFEPALGERYDRSAWRDTPTAVDLDVATARRGLMLSRTDDHLAGRPLSRMDVAALSADAPVPPGLGRVPGPGEAWVSPALAAELERRPADELADRFGTVVGIVAPAGLRAPDELAAVVGRHPGELRADGARVALELDGTGDIPVPPDPIIRLLVLVSVIGALAPVAVFVATATRLSAARREQRLAALRLAGATPGQVTVFAAVEALAATIPGALGGVALFLLLRPLVALVPLDQAGWFPEAIAPSPVAAGVLLVVVQVTGMVAAVVALRRVAISPLGVQRRERPRPLSRLRLVPVVVALVVFGAAVAAVAASDAGIPDGLLWVLGGAFFAIIVGIAVAGPWITALAGALTARLARGPVGLLAGRRLADDPRSAFGAIGGVVMAVFIGSAYLSIAGFTAAAVPNDEQLAVRPDVLLAGVPGDGDRADGAAARLAATPGVVAVAVIREVLLEAPDGTSQLGVIASCEELVAVLRAEGLRCGDGLVHLGPRGRAVTEATLQPTRFLGGLGGGGPVDPVTIRVDPSAVDRYAPEDPAGTSLVAVPPVIVEPAAVPHDGDAYPASRIAILTDGTPGAVERARTAVQVAMPTSVAWTVSEAVADATAVVVELGRVVSLGVVAAMVLAGASVAIAVITGLVERRRPFALLRLGGMPLGRLRAVLVLEAATPLVAVAALSAVLGSAVVQLLLRPLATVTVPPPDLSVVALLAVAIVAALGVVALALPLVDRITSTEATRFE